MANLLWGTIYILKVLLLYFMKVYSGEIYLGEATDKEVFCMTMMDNSEQARGCYHLSCNQEREQSRNQYLYMMRYIYFVKFYNTIIVNNLDKSIMLIQIVVKHQRMELKSEVGK